MEALTVKNLTKQYGKILAVDGISFEVAENEIFVPIGALRNCDFF